LEETCQRCHETLRGADRYCAVCGLPQLIYLAADMPQMAEAFGQGNEQGNLAGVDAFGSPERIVWRPALNAALTLAVPAGILCFGMLPLGLLGMMAAAAWAVGLYAKRARPVDLTAGTGARIGLVTGLFASWLTVALYGAGLWISRFVLHEGGDLDSLWTSQVEKNNQQMLAQLGAANAQSLQMAQSMRTMMLSVEGRAGIALSGMMVVAALVVLLAVAGGALGARLAAAPRRPGV
jgi:hypothetical protein